MMENEMYPFDQLLEAITRKTLYLKKLMKISYIANCVLGIILYCTFFDSYNVRPHWLMPCKIEYFWIITALIQSALGATALMTKKVKVWCIYLVESIGFVQLPLFTILNHYLSKPLLKIEFNFSNDNILSYVKELWESVKSYCMWFFVSELDNSTKMISSFMVYWCIAAFIVQTMIVYIGYKLMILIKIRNNILDAQEQHNSVNMLNFDDIFFN